MMSVEDLAVADILGPTDTVIWGQGTAEPRTLTRTLVEQRETIDGARVLLGVSYSDTCRPEHADHLRFAAFGGYGMNAQLAAAGALDIIPTHVSSIPSLIRSGTIRVDVVFLQVTPPDVYGKHRLGLAVDYLPAVIAGARTVVAEINEHAPMTCGDTSIDPSLIDVAVVADEAPLELVRSSPSTEERSIGQLVAERIPDGSVLQFGIGTVPDAVCSALTEKRDLGVHSGVIGEGVVDLIECGAITNRKKLVDPGVSIGGVLFGTRRLYEFADANTQIELRPIDYTHSAAVIGRFDSFVSIQSALEVDLTGQVNSETINGTHVGAVGGAVDFIRGTAASPRGTSIVGFPSTARSGSVSRIVARLADGVVTAPRSDVDLVVTEYGVAELRGRTLRERARNLIAIAHPDFRSALAEAAVRLA
jgi:acyl-CoA hydrolase